MRKMPLFQMVFILGIILFFNSARVSAEPRTPAETGVVINEIMASNQITIADEDGDFPDWIEIYNASDQPVDLNGWFLSDNPKKPKKWTFPEVTIAEGEYLLIWASDKDRRLPEKPLHSNFKIDADGEPVLLSSPSGEVVDQSPSMAMPADISYGRCSDAGVNWCFFDRPTPGTANITPGFSEVLAAPTIDRPAGFYDQPISVNISHTDRDVAIFYTLDGSEPSPDNPNVTCLYLPIIVEDNDWEESGKSSLSSLYNLSALPVSNCLDPTQRVIYPYKNQYPRNPEDPFGPFLYRYNRSYLFSDMLQFSDRSSQPYEIATINTQFSQSTTLPIGNIRKATVLRARAFKENALPSPIVTRTYFIDEEAFSRYSLPIISVVTSEENLFDHETGIYVPGKIADEWRLANPTGVVSGGTPANYQQRGDNWERKGHIEFFGPDGAQWLSQNIGLRINGGISRSYPLKSLRLYALKGYGETGTFEYPLFPGLEKKGEPGESLNSFKRLVLRNSGNDFEFTYFRDGLMQSLVKHTLIDTQAFRPALHFINGEYWGLINIRERRDKYYIASHYDLDPDDVVILSGNVVLEDGVAEDRDHYLSTIEYIRENGVSAPEHYAYLQTRIDTENFIDYNVAEIYFANIDWPNNNIDYWRKRTDQYEPDGPTGHDGRWRWILYDTDAGFGLASSSSHNTLEMATATDETRPDWSTFLLRSCLENQDFRQQFINRFADLLNSAFLPERVIAQIDQMESAISSEIPTHIDRWRYPTGFWGWRVQDLRIFANQRPGYVRGHIQEKFGLSGSAQLTLRRNLDGGTIQVNSIVVDGNLPGHPSPATPYPWSGVYFKDLPIMLKAIPDPGYQFTSWTVTPAGLLNPEQSSDPQITLTLAGDTVVKANFSPVTP